MTLSMLTRRQFETLNYARLGLGNKQTAVAMGIDEDTVKYHRTGIMSRWGVTNITHAVATAYENGIFELDTNWKHCGLTLTFPFCPSCGVHRNRVPGAETLRAHREAAARRARLVAA